MTDYYFLLASLPKIEISKNPPITFKAVLSDLELNLSDKDWITVRKFTRYYDLLNVRAFWTKKTFDTWGFLDEKELDEVLLIEEGFPDFVFEYLRKYPDDLEKIKFYPELLTTFFSYIMENEEGFLKKYFGFQKTIRLIISVLKIDQEKENLDSQLFFEDLKDITLLDIIKNAASYEDEDFDYRPLAKLLKDNKTRPLDLFKKFMEFQFSALDCLAIEQPFSLDQILVYLAKLRIVTELFSLDQKKGKQIVDQIA